MPLTLSGNDLLTMHDVIDSSKACKLLHSVPTRDESSLVVLRSKLFSAANRLGIPDLKRENVLLVASELATNNIKHAGGRGMIQVWQQPGPVLDVLSLDYGPGINDLALAEQDGYSSANTFGKGLGAIRRLSDESYFYTQTKAGDQVTKWTGTVSRASISVPTRLACWGGLVLAPLSDHRYNGDPSV
jgi:anti-sigma regulatory factor (Ser/Thr protein kinase)